MRWGWILLCCLRLAAGDAGVLHQLASSHRFFELRRALEEPGWNSAETLFYRGVVACRFGHEADGIKLLRQFLAKQPSSEMAAAAQGELALALERMGRLKEASQSLTETLARMPKDDSSRGASENTRLLLDSLNDVPPETVDFGPPAPLKAAKNQIGSWDVPVSVNGVAGHWIFDTGASISTVSESEARRIGLSLRDSNGFATGSTGAQVPLHLAVARDLEIGNARVHNVALLVLADHSMSFGPVQIAGILGVPVLRALGRVRVGRDGTMAIRAPEKSSQADAAPNLYFDGELAVVEIAHGTHRLQMALDTGFTNSVFYPSSRSALSAEELSNLPAETQTYGGAGGSIQRKIEIIPELEIQFFSTPVSLKNLSLFLETPSGAHYCDGVIGMDALESGFLLDFVRMRFEVQ